MAEPNNINLRHLRRILMDALQHAKDVASHAIDATEGTDDLVLFDNVRKAIDAFIEDNPHLKALDLAAIRHLK